MVQNLYQTKINISPLSSNKYRNTYNIDEGSFELVDFVLWCLICGRCESRLTLEKCTKILSTNYVCKPKVKQSDDKERKHENCNILIKQSESSRGVEYRRGRSMRAFCTMQLSFLGDPVCIYK